MIINERGYWENLTGKGHLFDDKLANAILDLLKEKQISSLVDFGCGLADYVKVFKENNIYCKAYDGNPNTETLTGGLGSVLDLSQEIDLNETFDCVLSLEVGEHIPKDYEQIFINNLCKHSKKYIILSWAVLGQGGDGHVNCQNNDYIINEMFNRNYTLNLEYTNSLREKINLFWFKDTLMVFEKNT
jgi:hypothetical protein